jgi:hypothetical protein
MVFVDGVRFAKPWVDDGGQKTGSLVDDVSASGLAWTAVSPTEARTRKRSRARTTTHVGSTRCAASEGGPGSSLRIPASRPKSGKRRLNVFAICVRDAQGADATDILSLMSIARDPRDGDRFA